MLEKIKFQIEGIYSQNDKTLIETEIDVLRGVANINVNQHTGEAWIEFEETEISQENIFEAIKKLGYVVKEQISEVEPAIREHLYFVQGMHCASCEILIEKRLLKIKGIESAEAKANRGEVLIEYIGKRPKLETLNSIFRKENYVFSDLPRQSEAEAGQPIGRENNFFKLFIISALLIVGFLYLNKLGLSGLVNVSSKSSLPAFFVLGLVAGFSSCAALVGGMVLSMSKQWLEIYSDRQSTFEKLQPHLMFNVGRIISYAILGVILGIIGSKLQISLQFTSFVVIAVSILMFFFALQMLGVKSLRKFQVSFPPKFVTRYIADETNFKGRYMPFLLGALTFFLPCGFTITAQGLALLSGNPIQGGLIMGFFALGTAFPLLLIGFSVVKFSSRPHLAYQFSKVAGILILFFALFNINNQLNVLGISNFSNLSINFGQSSGTKNNSLQSEKGLPPVVNGKQILKMDASASGYSPNYFKIRAGTPVRWEITDTGTSGCTNAIISRSLFNGEIPLTPGQVSVKEFTPTKPGKYKFSCWMGMVSGIIEVVDGKGFVAAQTIDNDIIPSGAKGCGCGGGSNGSCGAR